MSIFETVTNFFGGGESAEKGMDKTRDALNTLAQSLNDPNQFLQQVRTAFDQDLEEAEVEADQRERMWRRIEPAIKDHFEAAKQKTAQGSAEKQNLDVFVDALAAQIGLPKLSEKRENGEEAEVEKLKKEHPVFYRILVIALPFFINSRKDKDTGKLDLVGDWAQSQLDRLTGKKPTAAPAAVAGAAAAAPAAAQGTPQEAAPDKDPLQTEGVKQFLATIQLDVSDSNSDAAKQATSDYAKLRKTYEPDSIVRLATAAAEDESQTRKKIYGVIQRTLEKSFTKKRLLDVRLEELPENLVVNKMPQWLAAVPDDKKTADNFANFLAAINVKDPEASIKKAAKDHLNVELA